MKKKQNVPRVVSAQVTNKNVEYVPKKDLSFRFLEEYIDTNETNIKIISKRKWYTRLWYVISNPFCYIFLGYIRY